MPGLTRKQWLIDVFATPDGDITVEDGHDILGHKGCKDIEWMGGGTFQARVPTDWAAQIRKSGLTLGVRWKGRKFIISGEMP